jgi:N-acetylmuramoyl-L-alanine amidase
MDVLFSLIPKIAEEKEMSISGRLAIVVGHTESAQGANGVAPLEQTEFEYNSDLADLIARLGESEGLKVDTVYRPRAGYAGIREAYEIVSSFEPDAAIELHFNAFNGRVRGTETLYSDAEDTPGLHELDFAREIQDQMVRVFNRRGKQDRGLKSRPRTTRERGWYNVNQTTLFPSILIEPFFGDNEKDAALAISKKDALAACIVKGFQAWQSLVGHRHGLV